jgi:antitoxin HicB
MARTVEEYLSLPYTIVLRRDVKDEIFVARVEELPGCSAHADTEQEALSNLRDNMRVWIGDCLESGDEVPEPVEEIELPSGKWLQRVPRSLHLKLIYLAKREGVSLNQLVTSGLAEMVGDKLLRAEVSGNIVVDQQLLYSDLAGTPCWSLSGRYDIKNVLAPTAGISLASEAYLSQLTRPHGRAHRERNLHVKDKEPILAYQT